MVAHVRGLDHQVVGVRLGRGRFVVHAVPEQLIARRHSVVMRVGVMVGVLVVARRGRLVDARGRGRLKSLICEKTQTSVTTFTKRHISFIQHSTVYHAPVKNKTLPRLTCETGVCGELVLTVFWFTLCCTLWLLLVDVLCDMVML